MNETGAWRTSRWSDHPLCARYHLVVFRTQTVMLSGGGGDPDFTLRWAMGTRGDGQHEVLGLWRTPTSGESAWREIFEDLAARGVERIRFVVGADADALQAAQLDATALTLNSQQGSANFEPPSTLPTRLRHIVKSSQEQAGLMQNELGHLIRRHGPFESTVAASGFLERSLERMDRRFWTATPVRARSAHRHSEAEPLAAAL